MQADQGIHRGILEGAVVEHAFRPLDAPSAGLEDEFHRSRKLLLFMGQQKLAAPRAMAGWAS
ncbi:hypothetical protein MASR1M66_23310 [Aminivibrio sp.]